MHLLQEKFYLGDFRDFTPDEHFVADLMEGHRESFFEEEDFFDAVKKLTLTFSLWKDKFGIPDLSIYEIEDVERQFEAALPDGTIVTGRIDILFREIESRAFVIKDTKTTSWSPESAHKKVEIGDQATMYTWLIQNYYGLDQPIELIPDIAYLKPKVPALYRYGSIRRSKADVEAFVLGLMHDWTLLRSSFNAYSSGKFPEEYLFPRHATVCSEFGCEYEDICRSKQNETLPPPAAGFVQFETISPEFFKKVLDKVDEKE